MSTAAAMPGHWGRHGGPSGGHGSPHGGHGSPHGGHQEHHEEWLQHGQEKLRLALWMTGGRGRRGPGGWGFPGGPWGGPPWGGPPWGPRGGSQGPPFGRGPKVGRGDVRAAALVLLAEQPLHGYQIIQELERRSGGVWRPSPGSVYPALQLLEDEGLVKAVEADGRRVYELTKEGRAYVEARAQELGTPWQTVSETVDDGSIQLRDLIMQTGAAVMQVASHGSEAQVAEAKKVLSDARRALYRILADGEPASTADRGDPAGS